LTWDDFAIGQRINDQFPNARDRPTPKLTIDARQFAKLFRKIALLRTSAPNQEYRVHNSKMIVRKQAAEPTKTNDEWFEKRPFSGLHRRSHQGYFLQKATSNQARTTFGHPVYQENLMITLGKWQSLVKR